MSALRDAINKLGGVTECARICGISPRGVYKWLQRDALPRTEYTGETQYARRMAEASNGAFTAEWLLSAVDPSAESKPAPDEEQAPQSEAGHPKREPGCAATTAPQLG